MNNLLELAEEWGRYYNVTHWRVAYRATGNGQFFKNLRNGAGCTLKTHDKVLYWFSTNWPEDLPWPKHINRPLCAKG